MDGCAGAAAIEDAAAVVIGESDAADSSCAKSEPPEPSKPKIAPYMTAPTTATARAAAAPAYTLPAPCSDAPANILRHHGAGSCGPSRAETFAHRSAGARTSALSDAK